MLSLLALSAVTVHATTLYTLRATNGAPVEVGQYADCSNRDERHEFLDDCHPYFVNDTIVPDMMQCFGEEEERPLFESIGLEVMETRQSRPFGAVAQPPAGYDNPTQLFDKFTTLERTYPTLVRILNLNQVYNTPLTIQNRIIYAVKISQNVGQETNRPNLLVVGNHHARELITPQLVLDTAERLARGYNSDTTITNLLNNNQVYLVWTMNPDGLAFVWSTNDMWRKNRRQNTGGSFGVDQNRNYPIGWSLSCGGSTTPTAEDYRGTAAASEAETRTMLAFQNDRQFAKVLDFHSHARDVRINYGSCAALPTNVDQLFAREAQALATRMNYIQVRSCCMGGQIHVTYHDHGSLAFLVETGTAFQPPADTMRAELVRVWPGTIYFLSRPISVAGFVTDSRTGAGITANINIPAIRWNLSEQRRSNGARWGRYHLWLPTGTYAATVSATGYTTANVQITVTEGQTTNLNIPLTPTFVEE